VLALWFGAEAMQATHLRVFLIRGLYFGLHKTNVICYPSKTKMLLRFFFTNSTVPP
jgi:hypothetical protein